MQTNNNKRQTILTLCLNGRQLYLHLFLFIIHIIPVTLVLVRGSAGPLTQQEIESLELLKRSPAERRDRVHWLALILHPLCKWSWMKWPSFEGQILVLFRTEGKLKNRPETQGLCWKQNQMTDNVKELQYWKAVCSRELQEWGMDRRRSDMCLRRKRETETEWEREILAQRVKRWASLKKKRWTLSPFKLHWEDKT